MPFVDSHVHLNFPDYREDLDQVMERARAAGVELFVNIGTGVESSLESIRLAEKYGCVYATAGIHPHDAKDADAGALGKIEEFLRHPKMVAIGEVGLDFFRQESPAEKQTEVFRNFVRMHKRTAKPLIIHCRDAYEELTSILKEEGSPPWKGVMHCFSSDKAMMKRFLDFGFFISFTGALTYKKNDILREACQACPLERLLLETDGPFLPPQSKRGKRNESSYMIETAEWVGRIHGVPVEEVGRQTTQNAKALFGLC